MARCTDASPGGCSCWRCRLAISAPDGRLVWQSTWSAGVDGRAGPLQEQRVNCAGEPMLCGRLCAQFFKALGFNGSRGRGGHGLRVSERSLRTWAVAQGFPCFDAASPAEYSFEHALRYLWDFYAASLDAIAAAPGLAWVAPDTEPTRQQRDFELCRLVLQRDAEQGGVDVSDRADVDAITNVVKEQLFAATGLQADPEFVCEHIPAMCTHLTPNPMIAYALLLGPSPADVVGCATLPMVHNWMAQLLRIPIRGDVAAAFFGPPALDAVQQENLALRRELGLRKRGRTNDLEAHGDVVRVKKREGRGGRATWAGREALDKLQMLEAIHAVKCKIALRNTPTSLRHSLSICEQLVPQFDAPHIFDDLPSRQTLANSCLHLSDALDAFHSELLMKCRGPLSPSLFHHFWKVVAYQAILDCCSVACTTQGMGPCRRRGRLTKRQCE